MRETLVVVRGRQPSAPLALRSVFMFNPWSGQRNNLEYERSGIDGWAASGTVSPVYNPIRVVGTGLLAVST